MIRRVFASRIAKATGHPATAVDAILEAAVTVLTAELGVAGRFEWRGLGTFTVRTYPARKIHVPATGKTLALPARRSVTFKPSARIRSQLQPPPARRRRRPTRSGQRARSGI